MSAALAIHFGRAGVRREKRAVQHDLAEHPDDATRVRPDDVRGDGLSARWAQLPGRFGRGRGVAAQPGSAHVCAATRVAREAVGRDLAQSVVVVSGASSSVGRAIARGLAREQARLVLAARADEPLQALGDACRRLGSDVRLVRADVRDEHDVRRVAALAVGEMGRIDTWVNAAGVISNEAFAAMPSKVFLDVLETNLSGQIHAAHAVVPQFRCQGQGVLISLGPVWGRIASPHATSYVTGRFAVRMLNQRLRHELRHVPGIAVSTVMADIQDTPVLDRLAVFAGRPFRALARDVDPDMVADQVVRCARGPAHEVSFARPRHSPRILQSLAPLLHRRVMPRAGRERSTTRRRSAV